LFALFILKFEAKVKPVFDVELEFTDLESSSSSYFFYLRFLNFFFFRFGFSFANLLAIRLLSVSEINMLVLNLSELGGYSLLLFSKRSWNGFFT
jgi:hypothetical protein